MLVRWLVTVVRLNDLVEEWSEGVVRVVGTSIDTDTGVSPLRSGHDGLSESETVLVSSIFALLPDFWGEALGEEGFGAIWEVWHVNDVLWALQMWTDHGSIDSWSFGEWTPSLGNVGGERFTHLEIIVLVS